MNKPVFQMLIGAPGSGKTTWRKNVLSPPENAPVLISTDHYLEQKAKDLHITYNKVFSSYFKDAENDMIATFNKCLKNNWNMVVDRTNMSKKSRKRFLSRVPENYFKQAVVFERDLEYLFEINNTRIDSGRDVPLSVIEHMAKMYQIPTHEEGFDSVIFVKVKESVEEIE